MSLDPAVHVALLPSAGMGHLTPFLRLASMLVHHNCNVTLITPQPTVSNAESKLLSEFFSSFPKVNHIKFQLPSSVLNNSASHHHHDPFFLQFDAIRNSSNLLPPLLDSLSPPISAFVYDVLLTSPILPIASTLGVPHYILFTSSAAMFSFFSCFPTIAKSYHESDSLVEIPGVSSISRSSIPMRLLDPKNILGKIFMEDSPKLTKLNGVLINTFEGLEVETLEALNSGKVVKELPPIYAIGPFLPCGFENEGQKGSTLKWLDDQPSGSVVYVCFGSRTALGRDQIREIGDGLVRSGYRFLWVVKDNIVDKFEEEEGLDNLLGIELVERAEEKGLVVKEWVDQREILGHRAVGGFVSHCGWNSVTEAAWFGVPILGWPLHGDQKINAEVVLSAGWGVWKKDWGWEGERLVRGDEIGDAINELMSNQSSVNKATEVKNAAREATSVGGKSEFTIQTLIEEWKKNEKTPTPAMSPSPMVHVALLPSAGMGHLTPFLRLASMLVPHNCHVSLIMPHPTVSNAESKLLSRFLSSFPQVNLVDFHLLPSDDASVNNNADPFFLRFEAIRRSSHLLLPILNSISPPLSSFIYDMTLISPVLPVANTLGVPHYILFTSSAVMFSFFSYYPTIDKSLSESDDDVVEIPGVSSIPGSSIPPPLLVPNSLFGKIFMEDSPKVTKVHGVLINTFEGLEVETLEALNSGKVIKELPPIHVIGPFVPCEFEKEGQKGSALKWLDDQPSGSVVYVCFGSRTALRRDQIREIGDGLVRSGYRFLWVVKDNIVDKFEEEGLDDLLGIEIVERAKEKGLVVKEWVDQREILGHRAVGGFVSHCGWNSVTEAAWFGVPILGWPLHGDQKINAEVVLSGGWGVWKKDWGWEGERLVRGDEIGDAINELMSNQSLVNKATEVKNAAREATSVGGKSEFTIQTLIEEWKKNGKNL